MRRLAILTVTALLLAGCTSGSDSDSPGGDGGGRGDDATQGAQEPSTSGTTPAPTGPECADVWQVGATLPKDYDGCVQDGAAGPQDVTPCLDGSSLVIFDDALYAVTGSTIIEPEASPLQDTEEFGAAFSACTGEE